MIEAELKARIRDPRNVWARLNQLAAGEAVTYRDVYLDQHGTLDAAGRELRVRTVERADGTGYGLLTYKEPTGHASGSKEEREVRTDVADAPMLVDVLGRLGYQPAVELTKWCTNYRLRLDGRDLLATVVEVPELDGAFIEVEAMAEPDDLEAALTVVRHVLADLGVSETDLTDELYTDAVRAARLSAP